MISYKTGLDGISAGSLEGFFEGWKNKPSAEKHLQILQNSSYIVLALDGDKVAGFINAIADKTLSAYIPLLEVLPEYRGKGIGKELVKKMLDMLKNYYMVDLCCDESLAGYYEKLGMQKVSGMIIRNYKNL
jgi:ribosomal protein S18 acetylase RimI-like enzyme